MHKKINSFSVFHNLVLFLKGISFSSGNLLLCLIFTCLVIPAKAQQVLKTTDFIVSTPFLEPEEIALSLKHQNDGIVNLGKSKGGTSGESTYVLEYRLPNLEVKWSVSLRLHQSENLLHLSLQDETVTVFTVKHDEKERSSLLNTTTFNIDNGVLAEEKLLIERKIEPWKNAYGKGAIKNDFINTILSGSKSGYVTPLEYKYHINTSPDSSKILIYYYNFSKDNLLVEGKIYNSSLGLENEAKLPIDNGYLSSELQINDRGDLFLLNTKEDGTIALIQYDLQEKDSKFLSIAPSNYKRNSFLLNLESDDIAHVSNLSFSGNILSGLMISRFNFETSFVDSIYYYDFGNPPVQAGKEDSTMKPLEIKPGNYELVQSEDLLSGKVFFIEQRDYLSAGQSFDMKKGDDIENWKSRKGRVIVGDLLLVKLDSIYQMNWAQIVQKSQSNISDEGLITSGFKHYVSDKHINILYAEGVGSASMLRHLSFDILHGDRREIILDNAHNLILLRPYTQWLNQKSLVIAGKKGFGAKSSMLVKYKIEER